MPDLTPGVPSALSPLVRRVVAPNPGPFTGPGTNTYLVGIDEVAVIDPGPDDKGHVGAIVGASMKERVRWVVLTHTHPDHAPATARLVKATGAEVVAFGKHRDKDCDVVPDRVIDEGDTLEGTEFGLEVLHTPGHAPNHLCFLLEEERVLFTGDTVLDGTWSVVNPKRGGDMTAYLESLQRLRKLRVSRIAPGHGDVIEEPRARIDEYLAHRRQREQQILRFVKKQGDTKISEIVEALYGSQDLPAELVEAAGWQVHAHLLRLKAEGKVAGTSAGSLDGGGLTQVLAACSTSSSMRAVQPAISMGGSRSVTTRSASVWNAAPATLSGALIATGEPVSPPRETAGSIGICATSGASISCARAAPPPVPKMANSSPSGATNAARCSPRHPRSSCTTVGPCRRLGPRRAARRAPGS